MLHEFLTTNRELLVRRCRDKVIRRPPPPSAASEQHFGVPLFIDQLIETLRLECGTGLQKGVGQVEQSNEIAISAREHGKELLKTGFSVGQVVHDYGDLCQSITELAVERKFHISVEEFHTFNRCLDGAIADAVTEFGRHRDILVLTEDNETMNERLGSLAHELRNLLHTAMLAFQAMENGSVALRGSTGAVLSRSLIGLGELVDRSLADARMQAGHQVRTEPIAISELFEEVLISAGMDARAKGIRFSISPVEQELAVDADRLMLSAAIANLLQNAFKFSRPRGHVTLTAYGVAERIVIEIHDECGGLPPGTVEELFKPFEQRSRNRTGLGLGLSISRRGVEANGGELRVRDLPGKGCIFSIDLARARA